MASKALLVAILLYDLQTLLAAPTIDGLQAGELATCPTILLQQKSSNLFPRCQEGTDRHIHIDDVETILLGPLWTTFLSTTHLNVIPEDQAYPFSFSFVSALTSTPSPEPMFITVTVTKEDPTTTTVSALPITITETVTVTPSSKLPTSSTSSEAGMGSAKTVWSAPSTMTDLSSFKVSKFTGGQKNMKIVNGIPSEASASPRSSLAQAENAGSAMQLLYPANSINPAQKPEGGAEFYATPIDITNARNVTLQYSVFFPADFDWVLAGKLPGLYGGHMGCSGGNAALDCFSTRLMWRKNGAGELYLYAPKDKQTKALCADPASTCDAAYGLSIGRGTFTWAAGAWTTIRQTVYLNTPGEQDGTFALDVDGERVIFRDDVFYRNDLSAVKHGKPAKTTLAPTKTLSTKKHGHSATSTDDGDIIGPILSGILGLGGFRRWDDGEIDATREHLAPAPTTTTHGSLQLVLVPGPKVAGPEPTITTKGESPVEVGIESVEDTEVKFSGIFFSTFFGGHDARYATPRDQYVWFKDFALALNS